MTDPKTSETEKKGNETKAVYEQPEFLLHLEELRNRIVASVVFFLIAAIAGFFAAVPVINALQAVVSEDVIFVQLTPGEALISTFKISLILGLVFSSPIWLFHVIRFISPGLLDRERLFVGWITTGGLVLFAFGVLFSYGLVLPSALGYLMDFGTQIAQNQISISRYLDFCLMLMVLTGVMFELPMVLFLLAATNIITADQLISQWRIAVVMIVVLAAVLTPSQDPVTLLIVAGMLSVLYFISLFPIKVLEKTRQQKPSKEVLS